MNAVLQPPVPRILPLTKVSRLRMDRTGSGATSGDVPLSVLLSKMPLLPYLCSAEELGVLQISSKSNVGAAVQALTANGASLALVCDAAEAEQASLPQAWNMDAPYLGLVQLSRLVLWMLRQAELADMDEEWTEQVPRIQAASLSEQPADAASVDRVDLPVLISEQWMGEGRDRGALPRHTEFSSDDDFSDGSTDEPQTFLESMSCFHFFKSVKVASLARTSCWQPFLPLSSSSTLLDAVTLTAQQGPFVLPVLSSKPPDQSDNPSCPPVIQGYLTHHGLLAALSQLSGLHWFDSLLGNRSLGQLVESGLGTDAQEIGIDKSTSLLQGLLHLYATEQAALPVFERTADVVKIVGELAEQDAKRLLTDEGLFQRVRQLTVGEYVQANVSRVSCNGVEPANLSSSETSAGESKVVQSSKGESSEVSNAACSSSQDKDETVLVFEEGVVVNSALKALRRSKQTRVYVHISSHEGSNGQTWSQAYKHPPPTLESASTAQQTSRGVHASETGSRNASEDHSSGARYTVLSGKDLVSVLTRTSNIQTKAAWDSFFENVVYSPGKEANSGTTRTQIEGQASQSPSSSNQTRS